MPVHQDEDFPVAFAILVAGMVAPAFVVAAGRQLLTLYVNSLQFVTVAAVVFGLIAWILIERLELDRTTFSLVAIAIPWPVLFTALIGFLLLHRGQQIPQGLLADVFRFLIGDVEGFFAYGALFTIAGVGAAGVSRLVEARAEYDGRLVATGVGLVVVLVVVLTLGANLAIADSVTITSVEPELDTYERPTLEVTLDGVPAELRLTAVAPDDTSVTKRLTRAEMRGTPVRIAVPIQPDRPPSHGTLPALAGTYRVRVVSLAGVTVDTATFTATSGTNVSLLDTQVGKGTPTWRAPPDREIDAARHDTTVGVLVENGGSFYTQISVAVGTPDDVRRTTIRDVTAAPGERLGIVLSVSPETVEAIRAETGGTATIGVYVGDPYGDPVAAVTVELPST